MHIIEVAGAINFASWHYISAGQLSVKNRLFDCSALQMRTKQVKGFYSISVGRSVGWTGVVVVVPRPKKKDLYYWDSVCAWNTCLWQHSRAFRTLWREAANTRRNTPSRAHFQPIKLVACKISTPEYRNLDIEIDVRSSNQSIWCTRLIWKMRPALNKLRWQKRHTRPRRSERKSIERMRLRSIRADMKKCILVTRTCKKNQFLFSQRKLRRTEKKFSAGRVNGGLEMLENKLTGSSGEEYGQRDVVCHGRALKDWGGPHLKVSLPHCKTNPTGPSTFINSQMR